MIFKLIGCIAILCATTALGFGKSHEIKKRTEELEQLIHALSMLCAELRFARTPLGTAFERLAENSCGAVKEFFRSVSLYMDDPDGITAPRAWEKALEENKTNMTLCREDINTLYEYGGVLGMGDVEGQISGTVSLKERLGLRLTDAQEKREKNQRLFGSLGVYAGLLICILLI